MRSKTILSFSVILLALNSCKKNAGSGASADIYVAGSVTSNLGGSTACYWKNNSLVTLGSKFPYSTTNGIAVAGNDVYVSGNVETSTGHSAAVFWKNGLVNFLSDTNSSSGTFAMTTSGQDIYITGYAQINSGYWKNGAFVSLPAMNGQFVYGITVAGNDVYTVGNILDSNGIDAAFWKNGVTTVLSPGQRARAYAIGVLGNDIYVAGSKQFSITDSAVYWKNGALTGLPTAINSASIAKSLAISGGAVYMVGVAGSLNQPLGSPQYSLITCWKNGGTILQDVLGDPVYASAIGQTVVSGTDVYIAGSYGSFPCYWKNQGLIQFSVAGQAQSIAVVSH